MEYEKSGNTNNIEAEKKHRKRIRNIKALLISFGFILVLMPTILSLIALMQIRVIDRRLGETQDILVEIYKRLPEDTSRQVDISSVMPEEALPQTEMTDNEDSVDYFTEELMASAMEDTSQSFESYPEEAEDGYRKVYLTFDDGPSIYTEDILDILQEYDVKATFFVNGREGMDEQYRRIVTEGHTLGMHSYSHDFSEVYADLDSFAEDYNKIHSYLYDITGVDSRFYRFPGGSSNTVSNMDILDCISYLEAKDVCYFDWNVSGRDAERGSHSAEEIKNNVISQINASGSDTIVVLLHDASDKRSTVEALPSIIESIQNMEDTKLLPITESTDPIRHIDVEK